MKRADLTEKILDIKRQNDWSWGYICEQIGGVADVLIVGALLGQMKLVKPLAAKAATLFGLTETEARMLNEVPYRGSPMPPTDPMLYRFYEMVMVNGPAWKALIEEEFGDGIMSAIDFDMQIDREANPKGDRVRITMSGKFLPYKYYGNEQGFQRSDTEKSSSNRRPCDQAIPSCRHGSASMPFHAKPEKRPSDPLSISRQPHPAPNVCRNVGLCTFPVALRGSASVNTTE
jgi:cyanate lyase